MRSDFFKLNKRDFLRGAIFATLTAAFGVVYSAIMDPAFDFTWLYWSPILVVALKTGIQAFAGYLMVNLFSNSEGGLGSNK